MKKIFRTLHLWLSIPFGLIISIICLSGASLVFENEIMELCYPERYFVGQQEDEPLPVDKLLPIVAESLPDSVAITGVSIPSDPRRAYQVNLSKPRRASVYVDQYTGEIKGNYQRGAFFTTMMRLHRWLLDSMKPGQEVFVGKMIVGTSTLLFVVILISGMIIWIPRSRKGLKTRLRVSAKKGLRIFWRDLHVAGGIYASVVLLTLALTGLTWSFAWYRTGFYKVFGAEMQQRPAGQQQQAHAGGGNRNRAAGRQQQIPFANWQEVYTQLSTQSPGYRQISLSDGSASISFDRMGNQRASDRYTFNPENGQITGASLYKDTDKSGKIRGWIYSVHVGSWGGFTTRIITFLSALLGGTLPLTGYYLWIKRKFGRKRARMKEVISKAA